MAPPAAPPLTRLLSLSTVALALLGAAVPARALETDQFTVPDAPLADIGPEVGRHVLATLYDVMQAANAKALEHDRAAARNTWGVWKSHHRAKAARFRSEEYLNRRLYEALAGGALPECKIELWVRQRRRKFDAAEAAPVLFHMTCGRGVYGESLVTKPLLLVDLSPTVNVHGSYIGLDKLGHLFQQGYEYYRAYRAEELRGGGERRAAARAVRLGVAQERGVFGEALVGVYSNADLAANYAGLRFYLNLTRPVRVNGSTLAPVLARDGKGLWVLNPRRGTAAEDLLRPFVSDHFNEALNPSRYSDQMRATVRAKLRRRADRFVAFYGTSQDRARAEQAELSTWHGEDYGHCGFDRVVTVADNCFRNPARPAPASPAPSSPAPAPAPAPPPVFASRPRPPDPLKPAPEELPADIEDEARTASAPLLSERSSAE